MSTSRPHRETWTNWAANQEFGVQQIACPTREEEVIELEFAVVDLETTGLDPMLDEIISFAAIPVQAGRVQPAELVSALVRP